MLKEKKHVSNLEFRPNPSFMSQAIYIWLEPKGPAKAHLSLSKAGLHPAGLARVPELS